MERLLTLIIGHLMIAVFAGLLSLLPSIFLLALLQEFTDLPLHIVTYLVGVLGSSVATVIWCKRNGFPGD